MFSERSRAFRSFFGPVSNITRQGTVFGRRAIADDDYDDDDDEAELGGGQAYGGWIKKCETG